MFGYTTTKPTTTTPDTRRKISYPEIDLNGITDLILSNNDVSGMLFTLVHELFQSFITIRFENLLMLVLSLVTGTKIMLNAWKCNDY